MECEIEKALEGRGACVRVNSLSILGILNLALMASALWRILHLLRCIPRGVWRESCGIVGFVLPVLVRGKPKNRSIGVAFCASAHRFPHVYLTRRVSTKVLGEVACLGSKTLRPELFDEVTVVRACARARARVFGFCGPIEAQVPYSPPAREVRMGKNMSTHESTATKR